MISAIVALSLLFAAQTPEEDAPAVRKPRALVPETAIVERDARPLEVQQRRLLLEAIRLERDALTRQSEIPGTKAENIAADQRRLGALEALVKRRIDPLRIAPKNISLLDHYLVRFALDRLPETTPDIEVVEEWRDANRRYLETNSPPDRITALQARATALATMTDAAVLRRFLIAIEQGALSDQERISLVIEMQELFPDANLPVAQLATNPGAAPAIPGAFPGFTPAAGAPDAASDPFANLRPFVRQAGADALPRLDGIEAPLGEVPSVRELLEGMRGGG